MWTVSYIFLCSFVVVMAEDEVSFKNDRPSLMVKLGDQAKLECCCERKNPKEFQVNVIWYAHIHKGNSSNNGSIDQDSKQKEIMLVNSTGDISIRNLVSHDACGSILFKSVKKNDTGVYRCTLKQGGHQIHSYGTYLHVYTPLEKTINLSENTKNKILTAQGILLLLCVLLPAFSILCQSKKLHELEKKKVQKEEENIYQGLNLDDCYAAYDQIERSQNNGPYQDVCNVLGDDIQLEKP